MAKTDPKKVPNQNIFFAYLYMYNDQTSYKKKSHFTIPLIWAEETLGEAEETLCEAEETLCEAEETYGRVRNTLGGAEET